MSDWVVQRERGSAAELHGIDLDPGSGRQVWFLEVERAALVLGSTQRRATVDEVALARHGTELAMRRSGGGAVLLVPGEHVWVDVVLPRDDPLWVDDVSRSASWLGGVWADALGDLGVSPVEVVEGPMRGAELARAVCFGGLATGEVVAGGAKAVGISQRRTREGARFQCVLTRRWSTDVLEDVLRLTPAQRVALAAVRVFACPASPAQIEQVVVERLPS